MRMKQAVNVKNLGEFEMLVLAALIHLADNAYGMSILQEIERRTERTVSIGAVYTTLARMEKKSYVIPRMGEATGQRGGRAKRYFKISESGQLQFERSLDSLRKMTQGITQWLNR